MARAAQRDRAPEIIVKSLPWRVWNGTGWEKHEGSTTHGDHSTELPHDNDLELGSSDRRTPLPSTSHDHSPIPWCETQVECAICLSEFVKGDRVRELPCHHIFHLEEVDSWLINRKKVVGSCLNCIRDYGDSYFFLQCPVCKADVTQPWHLSQTGKPRGVPATELSSDAGAITVAMSPVTERTPLLDDHRGRTDS